MQSDLFQSHVRTDEMGKLFGRNLAETLESGDFRIRSQVADGLLALLVAIAIVRDEVALLLLRPQLGVGIGYGLLVLYLGSLVEARRHGPS